MAIKSEVMQMTVQEAAGIIRDTDVSVPINLIGQPGIAKTSIIKAEAARAGARLSIHNLSQMEPTDLLGIPYPDGKITVYKVPYFWMQASTEAEDQSPMWLFFDDVVTASEQLQACLFSWVLERGNDIVKLRDNVRFLFAGNRVDDRSAANAMPKALCNRMMHLYIKCDVEVWLDWARQNGIHPWITAYVRTHQDKLNTFDPDSEDLAFATPRSYEMLSKALFSLKARVDGDLTTLNKVAYGIIGSVSPEFYAYVKYFEKCVSPEEIIKAPDKVAIPKERDIDVLHATVSSLEHYVKQHPKVWREALIYALRIMPELGLILAKQVSDVIMSDLSAKDKAAAFGSTEFTTMFKKWGSFLASK